MTICLGMLARDGVVIASDSQESDQYIKRHQQKIMTLTGPVSVGPNPPKATFGLAVTGAGDAGYLDSLFDKLMRGTRTEWNERQFQEFSEECLHLFYERHLFPLGAGCPTLQILIGVTGIANSRLYISHGSSLGNGFPYCAAGAGSAYALGLLSGIGTVHDIKKTELLAAYVIALTKENIEYCGKYTQIVSLHNHVIDTPENGPSRLVPPANVLTRVPQPTIKGWEESFANKWSGRQLSLINELMKEELSE